VKSCIVNIQDFILSKFVEWIQIQNKGIDYVFYADKNREAINLIPAITPEKYLQICKRKIRAFSPLNHDNTADKITPFPLMSHSESHIHYSTYDTCKSSHYKVMKTNSVTLEYEIGIY
jgi:hypothetical protein